MAITVTLDSPSDGESAHGSLVELVPGYYVAEGDFVFSAEDDGNSPTLAEIASWQLIVSGSSYAEHTTDLTDFPHTFTIQTGAGASFNWSIEGWNAGSVTIAQSETRSVTMTSGLPGKPTNPSPAHEETDVVRYPTLSWDAG